MIILNNIVFLDIWTNGSISPNEALKSASVIIDLLTSLLINENKMKNH
jgi:DNA-directed RNA polymerase alpha subunit